MKKRDQRPHQKRETINQWNQETQQYKYNNQLETDKEQELVVKSNKFASIDVGILHMKSFLVPQSRLLWLKKKIFIRQPTSRMEKKTKTL